MRVISRNQKYDVPYEQTAFICDSTKVFALWNDTQWLFAEYSTTERAQKAMEMLRGFGALGNVASFVLPKDELIEGVYDEAKSHWKFQ